MADGVWLFFMICVSSRVVGADDKLRDEGGPKLGLVAAAKEEHTKQHRFRLTLFECPA
jgi:hypothetical protein